MLAQRGTMLASYNTVVTTIAAVAPLAGGLAPDHYATAVAGSKVVFTVLGAVVLLGSLLSVCAPGLSTSRRCRSGPPPYWRCQSSR
ncbi:hypothetical protein SAMN05414137_1083 [Streptacidiphilus jiangxiensis]|uniref:Uncharacterized protein n=2 Tax=Streptacidiphilus jiangxiensis TaxID=235985 RepID=A0A1H7PKG2_STRJI|nr:hypothetical protein SAMN05414137_1083 [Streptacidiphilus jiangxiensis]